MKEHLRPAVVLLLLFSVLCGAAYPLAVTGIAQATMPAKANGSLIKIDGKLIGSQLIGQTFTTARYFHGRPSAASTAGYDASASSGSNLGPSSKTLQDRIKAERAKLAEENPGAPVPADLLYASASGLDPEISPEAAHFQLPRVAAARGLGAADIEPLIAASTTPRGLGLLGEPAVNVLQLNLTVDKLAPLNASVAAPTAP